ncbi:MAG: Sapep family Mn(2+)-dependent dipeptidase [Clostridiales bacterium]|jgi:succinyl-diaminopimelate desuccinylase|nr:Sapep family Mn(2+)-dependent dipeptidase [Clostridiales bacterium]
MNFYLNDMVISLKKLLSFDSIAGKKAPNAPYGKKINDSLEYTLGLCRHLGLSAVNEGGLYGYAETGPKDGEIFAVLCHLDVVPFNRADWKHDPLGEISDGKIYGRGALDDKGPTVAALYAVKRLLDEGFAFGRRARFIFGLDEETGEWESVAAYFKKHGMPPIGIAPDADFPVINSEKGKVNFILSLKIPKACRITRFHAGKRSNIVPDAASMTTGDRALAEAAKTRGLSVSSQSLVDGDGYEISAVGKAAHGAHPEKGVNAAVKLLEFLKAHDIEPYAALYGKLSDCNGGGLDIDFKDDVSGLLTLNAGMFETSDDGSLLNVEIDVRYPHNVSAEELTAILKEQPLFCSVKQNGSHRRLYLDENDGLIKALLSAYNSVTGQNARPLSIGGATFARALDYGAAFGPVFPGSESTIHEADEFISIDDLNKTAEIYYRAFSTLLAR